MKIMRFFVLLLMLSTSHEAYAEGEKLSDEALKVLEPKTSDIVIGKAEAPVTLVEYASMSCGHCAAFHADMLPKLEEKYIKDGKLKIIFRHFPLNAQALKGSMLIECLDSSDRKQRFLKTLFKSQDKWAYNKDFVEKLKTIARIGGMKAEEFDACMNNKSNEDRILADRLDATNKLKVQSTPTLFLNGELVKTKGNDEFFQLIDSKL